MVDFVDKAELSERQRRELEYHRDHALKHTGRAAGVPLEIVTSEKRRWWNAYWAFYTEVRRTPLRDKRTLVVGCGFGDDAVRLAQLGARVYGFDLSPDSVEIAKQMAQSMQLEVDFRVAPAEKMPYENRFFDAVVVHDILHHVDIPAVLAEIKRVAKPGALFLCSEVYTHGTIERFRRSALINKLLYPVVRKQIYDTDKPYITEDERKIDHRELASILDILGSARCQYYYFIVQRLISERHVWASKLDRIVLRTLGGSLGRILAGRVQVFGRLRE